MSEDHVSFIASKIRRKNTMMPQEEMHKPTDSTYGRYEGNRTYSHPGEEAAYEQMMRETPVEKVYPESRSNQNVFRFLALIVAMVSLIAFAVICLVLVGGTGGWISFCAACLATFIVTVVAIDKIK
jgi:hypothetical protein